MEHWFGADCVDSMLRCSSGIMVPVPIVGVGVSAYRDTFIPRVAGGAGFLSLSDLIAEATVSGKLQNLMYAKTATVAASAAGATQGLWEVGTIPAAGANAAAVPGGTIPTRATTGALGQQDPGGSDQLYMTTWTGASTVTGSLLLYDRLASFLTSEATASNAVTGAQTRYTGAAGASTYPAGNFCAARVTTVRAATTPTVTITYTDQDNNPSASTGAVTLRSAAAVGQTCFTPPAWAMPLAAGDQGMRQITNITYSATSTGVSEFFLGAPIGILPQLSANIAFVLDGINSAFNLIQIQTGACLAFLEFFKTATAVQTYSGQIILVAG
jgi:hypothetical protein